MVSVATGALVAIGLTLGATVGLLVGIVFAAE